MEQHPKICFSGIKEVHYFSVPDLYKRGISYLHSFFKKWNNEPVLAVADTYLMIDHEAITRIYEYNPNMNIIVILRNPVDRAYSSYNYSVNYGHHVPYTHFTDSIDMEMSVADEPDIAKKNNVGHFYAGKYCFHLEKWFEIFKREQFLIMTTNELKASQQLLADKLFKFLDIPPISTEVKAANVQAVPRSKGLEKFLLNRDHKLRRALRWLTPGFLKRWIFGSGLVDKVHNSNRKQQEAEKLSPEEREVAMSYFKNDIESLEENFGIRNVL